MYKILTLNNISVSGLERLPREKYEVASEMVHPDAILLRSFVMHEMEIPASVKAVGRAGAGVNNIPVAKLSTRGVPVFNAPGANANAVKELVLAGMLLAARNICQAWDYTQKLTGDDAAMHKQVEAGKKKYAGYELPGRTLGVIGLGAIGRLVANMATTLGMKVIGYDPNITVEGAWKLSASVQKASSIEDLLSKVDFVSFHVPLVAETRHLINPSRIKLLKKNAVILNFAREGIVDDEVVLSALAEGAIHAYVSDFPSNALKGKPGVITLPHLGASTEEAEDNCAVMVADQVRDFLEHGNVINSVNFPEVVMERNNNGFRIGIVNSNVPNMVGQISTAMAKAGLNIVDMLNKSKGELAYSLIDVNQAIPTAVVEQIRGINGVLSVRTITR